MPGFRRSSADAAHLLQAHHRAAREVSRGHVSATHWRRRGDTSADTLIKVAGPAAVQDPPLALQMPLPWERRFVVTAQ
jgi:hypothetical protein